MHEMSLVRTLLAQVGEIVAANGGSALRCVRVQVGPLAGVEPALMATAWKQLSADAGCGDATLEVEEVPLVAHCRGCDRTFQPLHFRFRCPTCGTAETETISGDGVILQSVVLADIEQGAGA